MSQMIGGEGWVLRNWLGNFSQKMSNFT